MIALNLVVYGMPPIQGARRWIPLPFLQFQSSEFGKILLIVALAAFAVDRSRRLHEWRTTARIMLLALIAGAARDPAAGPRHRAWSTWRSASASCSSPEPRGSS